MDTVKPPHNERQTWDAEVIEEGVSIKNADRLRELFAKKKDEAKKVDR